MPSRIMLISWDTSFWAIITVNIFVKKNEEDPNWGWMTTMKGKETNQKIIRMKETAAGFWKERNMKDQETLDFEPRALIQC